MKKSKNNIKLIFIALSVILIIFLVIYAFSQTHDESVTVNPLEVLNLTSWDFKVRNTYAIVFYGRKPQARILLKYLEKNVKANGGILEKIVFCVKTSKAEDLEYLDSILSQDKPYYEVIKFTANQKYNEIYEKLHDDDLVFKIDDDIVFIANGTFEKMINEYVANKLLFLSANVVNHPILSYAHARIRAILQFYEIKNYTWVKYENDTSLADTVVFGNTYEAFSKWWSEPRSAAVAHESFFYHMKTNNLNAYNFRYWDFHSEKYYRWSINFVLMRGRYVNRMSKMFPHTDDDELTISETIPGLLKKNCYALGNAVVSHFSYSIQFEYLNNTNILDRYDSLSEKYLKIKDNG